MTGNAENQNLEQQAAQLHAATRRRADHFNQPVMADWAMALMLTALITHEQGTVLTRTAAAMANRIGAADAEQLIDELIKVRLMQQGDRRDHIALSGKGVDLMRDYVGKIAAGPQDYRRKRTR